MRFDQDSAVVEERRRLVVEYRPALVIVFIPAMRALITGASAGALVALVARLWRFIPDDARMIGMIGGLAFFLVAWLWPRGGDPDPVAEWDGGQDRGSVVLLKPRTDDVPDAESERLKLFVKRAAIDTGSRALRGAGFTDREVAHFRGQLEKQGWAEWRPGGKSQGWQLAADADTIIEALV